MVLHHAASIKNFVSTSLQQSMAADPDVQVLCWTHPLSTAAAGAVASLPAGCSAMGSSRAGLLRAVSAGVAAPSVAAAVAPALRPIRSRAFARLALMLARTSAGSSRLRADSCS